MFRFKKKTTFESRYFRTSSCNLRSAANARASVDGHILVLATRIDFSINFCLKQPEKMLAFFYGNFENSKSRGSIRKTCRPCRPHQTSGVVRVNAQTCVESIAFKNGPETCFSRFCRSNARSRADLEVVSDKKFPINVVNNLGQSFDGAATPISSL